MVSAAECADSASMALDPVMTPATSLATPTRMFAAPATMTAPGWPRGRCGFSPQLFLPERATSNRQRSGCARTQHATNVAWCLISRLADDGVGFGQWFMAVRPEAVTCDEASHRVPDSHYRGGGRRLGGMLIGQQRYQRQRCKQHGRK